MLRPREDDPNYDEEMKRFKENPAGWGTLHDERDILKGSIPMGEKALKQERAVLEADRKTLAQERANLDKGWADLEAAKEAFAQEQEDFESQKSSKTKKT